MFDRHGRDVGPPMMDMDDVFIPPVRRRDRVRLVSGGPVMTVERVRHTVENPYARCVWIDRWSRVHREPFDLAVLDIVMTKEEVAGEPPAPRERSSGPPAGSSADVPAAAAAKADEASARVEVGRPPSDAWMNRAPHPGASPQRDLSFEAWARRDLSFDALGREDSS